jgi:hypothetical protein
VPLVRVVPAFDETEYGVACFDLSLKASPVRQLALEHREEALGHRILVRVTNLAHRSTHSHFSVSFPEGKRSVRFSITSVCQRLKSIGPSDVVIVMVFPFIVPVVVDPSSSEVSAKDFVAIDQRPVS